MEENNSSQKKEIVFLSDDPISNETEDKLNLCSYVDALERIILTSGTPLNIGLFGRWGVGKTSILNLLKTRLEKEQLQKRKLDYLHIDAWRLSKESLRQQLLIDVNDRYDKKAFTEDEIEDELYNIREMKSGEEISETYVPTFWHALIQSAPYLLIFFLVLSLALGFRPYTGISSFDAVIGAIIIPMFLLIVGKLDSMTKTIKRSHTRVVPRIEAPHQFERIFKKILEEKGSRTLVVAIDNLDRCEDEVVVEMLGTIKNFMNVPGCVFVLACDNAAIENHLTKKRGFKPRDAKEFLRKFFQASITIRPFLDEDLERFMDEIMSGIPLPLDETVREVLMAATTKNPRRVKQFLNSIISTYYLAEANEKNGLIRRGTITGNLGILAKISVIRDEWPDFYTKLENQEDILASAEQHFRGEQTNQSSSDDITEYFKKCDGLEWFLRATRAIVTDDITPFLRLNEESYERTIPEQERFYRRVEFGDSPYILKTLGELEEQEKSNRLVGILRTINKNMKSKRFNFAFNGLNILCDAFLQVPEPLKRRVVEEFERYATDYHIKQHLEKFNPNRLFHLLGEMHEPYRETILLFLCDLLTPVEKLDDALFRVFIDNREIISRPVVDRLNGLIVQLLDIDEGHALRILRDELVADSEVKESMINEQTIDKLVGKIDGEISEVNDRRIQLYFELKAMAATETKKSFVEKMVAALSKKDLKTVDQTSQFALEKLGELQSDDFPDDALGRFYDALVKQGSTMSSETDKVKFFSLIFQVFSQLEQDRKDDFIEHYVTPLLTSGNQQTVITVITTSERLDVPLLDFDHVLSSLVSRASTNLQVPELITFLMVKSPSKAKEAVGNMLDKMIRSNNSSLVEPALVGFQENFEKLPPKVIEKIATACLDTAKGKPPPQVQKFFDSIVKVFKRCPAEFKTMFSDVVLEQMRSDNQKLRETGIHYYSAVREQIHKEVRKYVLGQLILRLVSVQDKIDGSVKPLVDVVVNDQSTLENDDLRNFVDILTGQLASTKTEQTQMIGLTALGDLKTLHRRSSQVLTAIFNLYKSSSSKEVRESCRAVLERFRARYKGLVGFWKEVDSLLESTDEG